MDAPTIRFMDCETCGRRTQHFRNSSPIMKVTFPYSVYRLDYPTTKYRCLECGEVTEMPSEEDGGRKTEGPSQGKSMKNLISTLR